MPLSFPHQNDDVRLTRSPLAEVVCQVRIPPILSIPENKPVAFQDRIRKRFPDYEVEDSVLFRVDVSSGAPIPTAQHQTVNRAYKFISRKRGNTVTLAEDFFALSSIRYTVWEEFASDLSLVNDAVNDIYEPSHATRIGLRYVNILDPEKLGLASLQEVVSLLQSELTSLYQAEVWGEPSQMAVQLVLDDEPAEGRLGFRLGKRLEGDKAAIQLDFDYFQEDEEGLPLEGLVERCDRYHRVIYDAFRWSIAEGGIDAFDPIPKKEVSE